MFFFASKMHLFYQSFSHAFNIFKDHAGIAYFCDTSSLVIHSIWTLKRTMNNLVTNVIHTVSVTCIGVRKDSKRNLRGKLD